MTEFHQIVSAIVLLLWLSSCSTPRPPGRDACYARADAEAFAAYLRECDEYGSVDDCPFADDIEARHRAEQEKCP